MKKRGFTLIELLAVIVILAIIALIATPIILGIIQDAKEEAEKRSVELYANAIKNAIVSHQMKNDKVQDGVYEINSEGDICLKEEDPSKPKVCIDVEVDGDKPTKGQVTITNGTIADMEVTIGDKDFIIDSAGKVEYKLAPGLYDKDRNLLVTWDELVQEIDKDIQTNNGLGSNFGLEIESKYSDGSILVIGEKDKNGNIITSIGASAFFDCDNLTSIVIPSSVTSIGGSAFYSSGLTSVTIPNSVKSIGADAFGWCKSLTSITIPSTVTSIGNAAFLGCTSLTSITIPPNVTSIGNWAFQDCTSLKSITIPDSVTSIGGSAFASCTSLTSIKIPNSVTSIGDRAFYLCSSLTSITIPNSVTYIGGRAFQDCSRLSSVYFEHTNEQITFGKIDSTKPLTFWKLEYTANVQTTFYFKNAAMSEMLQPNVHYRVEYGTKSTNYNW